jgi:hypothetical protein
MAAARRLREAGLDDIAGKLDAGVRLDAADGERLFDADDLLAVGWLANRERERRHGARTFYNYNIRIEATNVCVASCLFCSFARLKPGDAGAYTMSLEQVWQKLRDAPTSRSPRSTSSTACTPTCRSSTTRTCSAASSASGRRSPQVLHGRRDRVLRRSLRHDRRAGAARADGRGARLAARRRGGDLRAARAPQDLPRQVRRRPWLSIHRTRIASACGRT